MNKKIQSILSSGQHSTITKETIVNAIHAILDPSLTKTAITAVVDAYATVLAEAAHIKDMKLSIGGFGIFHGVLRKATRRHNPQTRKPMDVPAKRTITFSFNKALKESINKK